MSVNSALTNIADKIRKLLGVTGTMSLSAMSTYLGSEQTNIDNAYAAIESKGGTLPDSLISGMLANSINSIPAGVTVQVKTGTVTGVSGTAKTVNLGFKPDAVFFTGRDAITQVNVHCGVAFTEASVTFMRTLFGTSSTSYLFSVLTVGQRSSGFSVFGQRLSTSGSQTDESNRSLNYIAIKYTE